MGSPITLVALLSVEAPAAQPFELRWDAPSECPDRAAVLAAVELQLGRALVPPMGDGLIIDMRAEPQGDRWRVVLDVHDDGAIAHRELADATDCRAAVDATALVIAIAIDPPEAAPAPSAAVQARPGATDLPSDDRRVDAPVRTRAAIGATAAASIGELPVVGLHGRAFVAVLRPRLRVELGGSYGAAPTWQEDGASVDIARWTVDARACPVVVPLRWLEVLPCLGVEAGQTLPRPSGVSEPSSRDDTWAAGIAAPTLAFVPRRWLALRLGVELRVPFTRRRYFVDGAGTVHRTAPVTGALVAGIELRFP